MAAVVRFGVHVVDGECLPVPGLQIGARYKYTHSPSTWNSATTGGEGVAQFCDEHIESPLLVDLYIGDSFCDSFPVEDGSTLILEV